MSIRNWLTGLAILAVVGCVTIAPTLDVKQSSAPAVQRLDLDVALMIDPASRDFSQTTEIPGNCFSGGMMFAPSPLGEILLRTMQDRFSRLYSQVTLVTSADEAEGFDALFEVSIRTAGIQFACLISPQQSAEVTGGIRSLDYMGREIWRSQTIKGRHLTGMDWSMDFNRVYGDQLSYAIADMTDTWTKELNSADAALYAMGDVQGRPVQVARAKPRPSRRAVQTQRRVRFPQESLKINYTQMGANPDDIAVVIGNADYGMLGKDIPNVQPAHADADAFKRYLIEGMGLREGNIIDLRDATSAQMIRVLGSYVNHQGQLFDWVKSGRSRVFVYYAGHGAPADKDGMPYLVPVDADAARIDLNGYPLDVMYKNLAKIPAKSITVVLESCFSGSSQGGVLISNASPVYLKAKAPKVPAKITVITAGSPNQIASWEEDKSHSLFTKYYLTGMSGEADKAPIGNGNGAVSWKELDAYMADTVTYYARRYYGRDQQALIINGR